MSTAMKKKPGQTSGLRAVVESRLVAHEKLPMLEVVCERTARAFTTALRNLSSEVVDVALKRIASCRFGDWAGELPTPIVLGVVRIEPWKSYGVICFEARLVYALVDALLGGRAPESGSPAREREFTPIEIGLVAKVAGLALNEFGAAFTSIAPVSFHLERMETNPRFAAVARPSNTAEVAAFQLDMGGQGGEFSLLLPHATLEPARDKLIQRFMGEESGGESLWQSHMEAQIRATEVEVDVVMGETMLSLGAVYGLEQGRTIAFGNPATHPLALRCGGQIIGQVHAGQREGQMAVSLAADLARAEKGV